MASVSIVTWNVNSVRCRIGRILDFVARQRPHILCLQEIKCTESQFPAHAFSEAGMPHLAVAGQKGLHGVVVASRYPIEKVAAPDLCREGHARAIAVRMGDIEIHNLYVPAGGYVPDPEHNDKFAHKLDFLTRMEEYYRQRSGGPSLLVVGDLNIAPEPADVWSHRALLNVVSHTPAETEGLKRVIADGGFHDIARNTCSAETKLFTWWSYRARDWTVSDRGRRLDHIWANASALDAIDTDSFRIHRSERGGEKPSDHVPVSVEFRL